MNGISLLGHKVKDLVTGYEGVVDSVCYDLYGCIQAGVRRQGMNEKEGKPYDGLWFDIKRLEIMSLLPVMSVPDFNRPEIGASDKSNMGRG